MALWTRHNDDLSDDTQRLIAELAVFDADRAAHLWNAYANASTAKAAEIGMAIEVEAAAARFSGGDEQLRRRYYGIDGDNDGGERFILNGW